MRKGFTSIEYTDMIITYGMAGENAHAAARMYAERFPGRERYPTRYAIVSCVQRARDTGYVVPSRPYGPRRRVKEEEKAPRAPDESPGTGLSPTAGLFRLSQYPLRCASPENGLQPRQPHRDAHQQLLAADLEERVHFCEGFLAQCRRDLSFPDCILWTDEATFTPNGVFNSRNFLYWRGENPHVVHDDAFQCRWSINVWAGIVANRVIGPCFLPPHFNGKAYADFIENQLPVLLADVPLCIRARLIFQHDGSSVYFCREVRDILDARYPERWMAQGGPISWPARSPDLNVHDYFIWGYVKGLIEHRRDDKEHEVREAILAAFGSITPEMAHLATRDVIQRAKLCIREGGRHIER